MTFLKRHWLGIVAAMIGWAVLCFAGGIAAGYHLAATDQATPENIRTVTLALGIAMSLPIGIVVELAAITLVIGAWKRWISKNGLKW
jgi:putative effector of murein hydrolase